MKIELSQPFASNGEVDEHDVKQMKKALNRLGYYQPYEKVGITGIADKAVFDALKAFQQDHGLPATGVAKPDDETVGALNKEAIKTPNGRYIWRTVEDGKVRSGHAQFNRTIRAWSDTPDPGEEFNCRCWAEPLPNSASERKKALLGKGKADFRLKPDPNPVDDKPWHAMDMMSEVNDNSRIIEEESRAAGVNPDFVKAIIYVETTQGYYDHAAAFHDWASESMGLNLKVWHDSIRPMNIRAEYWKELGYTKAQLGNRKHNIRAGVDLIKRLQSHAPQATMEEIATLYNDLNAKQITDYGARVVRVMKEKPWEKSR
jgi:hypothetical protein